MKLQFKKDLPHQTDAVNAVVRVFDNQPMAEATFSTVVASDTFMGQKQTELGLGNRLTLGDEQLQVNVRKVQEANCIPFTPELQGRHFSIEMETGTGKTYVYLRTIFELNKDYGFSKFIIVVPSVAIREGVITSIEMMADHFRAIYNHVPFKPFVYDSRQLSNIREFATANTIQIMVINIQSFQKDVKDDEEIAAMPPEQLKKLNVINRESDRLSGRKPMEFIQATNPIVIIDEPQSVEGDTNKGETLSSRAIMRLNPLCTLRYSATHKNYHNLLYKLDPIQAYDQRLVKRIEVASVQADDNLNSAFVKLEKVDNRSGIKATLSINVAQGSKATHKPVVVKRGDDLFDKSKGRQEYRDGFIVRGIDCTPGAEYVEFSNGQLIELGQAVGGLGDEIMKAQVWETVEQHLKKERTVKGKGIKVLSLFFIDRVANYRTYEEDGSYGLGKIGLWFEEAYTALTQKPAFRGVIDHPVEKVHDGYFSQDRKGIPKDTSGTTKDDDDTYAKIMRKKEQLLSMEEPLRFIFSHSALREGWDNPNVFQICTLNETRSADRKRQEIGRGLRLPVNQDGERVHDEAINRLTVIANESYEEFARKLQNEYEEDYGIRFGVVPKEAFAKLLLVVDGEDKTIGQEASVLVWEHLREKGYLDQGGKILDFYDPKNPHFTLDVPTEYEALSPFIVDEMNRYLFKNRVVDARKKKEVTFNKEILLNPDFEALWQRISQRTHYRVEFSTEELIQKAAERLKSAPPFIPVRIETTKVLLGQSRAGIEVGEVLEEHENYAPTPVDLPDLLAYLQNETELTRHTLVEIIRRSGRAEDFKINPQQFITVTVKEITKALRELMLTGINYEKIDNDLWDMRLLDEEAGQEVKRYLFDPYQVKNVNRTTHDFIDIDSNVERTFATRLDSEPTVKLFMKLPRWFKVDTPIGSYNPDWAILFEDEERVYMVRETKDKLDKEELRDTERKKVNCGEKHFAAIGVDYRVVTNLKEALRQRAVPAMQV